MSSKISLEKNSWNLNNKEGAKHTEPGTSGKLVASCPVPPSPSCLVKLGGHICQDLWVS